MWEVWYFRVKFSQWIVERTWELEMKKRTVLRKRGNVYYILELLQWSDLGFVSIPGQIFLIMVFLIHLVSLIPFFLVALNLQSCKLPLKYVTYKTIKWFISLARFHHLEVYKFFRPFESFLWKVDKTLIIRMLKDASIKLGRNWSGWLPLVWIWLGTNQKMSNYTVHHLFGIFFALLLFNIYF